VGAFGCEDAHALKATMAATTMRKPYFMEV
jgi:hypothetical protein